MKVLLLNPPLVSPHQKLRTVGNRNVDYPIWLTGGAACLEKSGHQMLLIDASADDMDFAAMEAQAKRFEPDLLVINTRALASFREPDIAAKLKNVMGDIRVVLVGKQASARPEQLLTIYPSIDAVVRREFDSTLPALAYALENGDALSNVKGITFRSNGQVLSNPDAPLLHELDEAPFVSPIYKKYLHIRNYYNPNITYPMVTLMTSRGCPYGCTFCASPGFSGRKIRYRSIPNVLQELEYVREDMPEVKGIFFSDDTLTMNRQRCREFCQAMLDRRMSISWTANCRPDLDYDTLKIMKQAGCRSLCVGFESGNQHILNQLQKYITPSKMQNFMSNARKAGILISGYFMAGVPGETAATLKETLALSKTLNPDKAYFFPLFLNVHESALASEKPLLPKNPEAGGLTPDDIIAFCHRAHREFYSSPAYLGRKFKRLLFRPSDSLNLLRDERTFRKHCSRRSFEP